MNDLVNLTPVLKTSNADENTKNRIFNIIDYMRGNQFITKNEYHQYIKKFLM